MKIDVISKQEEDCNPDYAHQTSRTPSCDFDIKSTCDVELKSIYSEVIENCRKRYLKKLSMKNFSFHLSNNRIG